ncbi:GumC family protein [Opitutus terrae]|uniref:Capsular exopolysaccharide family n=1 Tax=Opitutus terrae (strain DSM 11246 / JCM 15787 / PB90-1) TaxID=452637 RepID=B1ZT68_OPITP|nr:polysaccharide biosynthesis tyrosine autokinase [Opitutus terrae]ACB76522.1 capsular exopolysaccharide family [Opitutus terrae PB90-1]
MPTSKKPAADRRNPQANTGFRITPRDLLQMFQERWLLGLFLGAIAAGVFVYFQPEKVPLYYSEVSLLFETRKDRVLNIQDVVDTGVRSTTELNVHAEQLRSQTFFEYVLTSFNKEEAERIQRPYRDPTQPDKPVPSLAEIIRPNLTIFARRNTTILVVGVTNRNPENAALIANRFARRYIDYNLDRANSGTNSAIIFLRNQAEELRAQVEAVESSLQEFRARNNIAALGENQNVVLQKVGTVGTALVRAQMEQVEMRSVLDKIDEYRKEGKDLFEIPAILGYGQVSALRTRYAELQAQRKLLGEKYLRLHPKMTQNELETTETKRLLDEAAAQAIANLETRNRIAAQHEIRLRAELEQAERSAHELDKTSVDYKFLEQDAATKRATYSRIVDRLNEASVASQMENTNIKIFDPAYVPGGPIGDALAILIAKASFIGVGLFVLIPLGMGLMDTRIKTVSHVEDALGEVLLGAVKTIDGLGEIERAHVYRLHKDDGLTESYRGIYSAIDIHSTEPFPKAIISTSSMPGDGKSLTASNLAAAFAAHGRRTLLVDCDLRRPVLHRYFGVDLSNGWIRALATSAAGGQPPPLPTTIAFSENLDLLPSGGVAKNPTETLERFVTSGMLKRLLERYDLVILDTPPVAVFPDALLLSRYCKELIFVCKYGSVRLNSVRKTLARVHETGIKVLGLVINQMPESRFRASGYEGYGAYGQDYYQAYAKTSAAQ